MACPDTRHGCQCHDYTEEEMRQGNVVRQVVFATVILGLLVFVALLGLRWLR